MNIIIVGAGKIGRFIASNLSGENKDVVIIDHDENKIAAIKEELDVQVIHGNGAALHILREAGIKEAQILIAVTDSDEVNLLACMMSNLETTVPIRVARVRNPVFYETHDPETLKKLNIDMIINPDRVAAEAILNMLTVPGSRDVINFLNGKMKLVSVLVKEESSITNKYLENLNVTDEGKHLLIAAIERDGHTIIPKGKNKILAGDIVYFATEADNITKMMQLFGYKLEKVKHVMISGGTFMGMYLAKELEKIDINVKIIEKDPSLCSKLIRNLDKSVVLNDSVTDQAFLRQENVKDMDAFISVTGDDENNVLSCLLAKSLGSEWTIALINEINYIPIITTIGVDVAVNPRRIANSAIMHFIRQGKVLSVITLKENVEVLEIEALETSDITNIPLKKAKIPNDALILCLERKGEIVIPYGETVIQPNDKVLILVESKSVRKIEKLFTVKLEYF